MCVIFFFIIWNLFQKFYWRGLNQTLIQVYLSWATFWNLFDLKLWWRWIHTQIENPNFEIFWIFNKSEKMSKISIFVTLRLNYSWIRTDICFRYSLVHGEYGPFRILNYIWYVTYPKFKNLVIWLSRIVRSFPVPFSRRFNVHPRFLHSKTKRA